ncbi:hypothetical protein PED39_00740 [Methanomassiliicoccales archaeon LGM-RCC1]|nr:hypothetical protein PED39_00740 [Methanomassiliicoccales archaeon LGM-RCC1]
MTIVVYSSKTGSSKKYAEAFASKKGYLCYSVKDEYDPNEMIVFFGWLRGPAIVGIDKINKQRLLAVASVSLEETPEFGWAKVKDQNSINVPFYHLRGWIDRKKLNIFDRLFFDFLCAFYKLRGFDDRTGPLFDAMMNGGSFYDESGLEPLFLFTENR